MNVGRGLYGRGLIIKPIMVKDIYVLVFKEGYFVFFAENSDAVCKNLYHERRNT